MEKTSYVYMMGSTSRRALYTGVTVPLHFRVRQHKNNQGGYFTSKYKCYRLIHFEQFTNVEAAIAREKEIKGWRTEKKNKACRVDKPRLERSCCRLVSRKASERRDADRFHKDRNIRSLRATRPLKTTRASSRPSG